jgi:hypothetical protein
VSSSLNIPVINSGDLEFIADHSGNLSLSPDGGNSGAVVGGMTHSGSPSLHAIPEESPNEDDSASSEGEIFVSPLPTACNMVTSVVPIATMPPPEVTPSFQILPTRPQQTATLTPLPEQLVAH